MKKLFILIAIFAISTCQAQKLTADVLIDNVFNVKNYRYTGKALFHADGSAYFIEEYNATTAVACARYLISNDSLIINFQDETLTKRKTDTGIVYSESRISSITHTIIPQYKDGWVLSTDHFELQPVKTTAGQFMAAIEDPVILKWLENNRDFHIDLFNGFETYSVSQSADDRIKERLLKKLNAMFYEVDDKGNLKHSRKYDNVMVFYSPDDAFKVFVASGEYCSSGFCSETFYSITQYADGKVEERSGHARIQSMYKIGQDRYLTISEMSALDSAGGNKLALNITTTHNHRTDIERLFKTDPKWTTFNYGDYYFSIVNPDWASSSGFYLHYNPETYKVSYSYTSFYKYGRRFPDYIPEEAQPKNGNEAVQVTGEFILKDGMKSDFKEQFEKIKIEH